MHDCNICWCFLLGYRTDEDKEIIGGWFFKDRAKMVLAFLYQNF